MNTPELVTTVRFKGMSASEKKRAINFLKKKGLSVYQIALRFQVTPQLIYYWIAKDQGSKKNI